eukprot:GILK01007853.1.p1 GENE.GILK01007853.1~~GILK01007853.1.p1  ORF type:complete len:148 (+),score=24.14 GILK01007853.1:33-476(+)
MGQDESNMAHEEEEDELNPWLPLVQWAAEDIPSNIVWTWDLDKVKGYAQSLAQQPDLLQEEIPDTFLPDFSMDTADEKFHFWASLLLRREDSLRACRFKMVPRRLKEDIFWRHYFFHLRRLIREHFQTESPELLDALGAAFPSAGGS